ncbi:hypothetical protein DXT91_29555 [Agrobacterium tumefaciens]|nr:hypothetical protein [Agrobacterium tumefaciens]
MVEEQTAASHSLACEATALLELLEQFRFDDAKHAPTFSNRVHHSPGRRDCLARAPRGPASRSPWLSAPTGKDLLRGAL